MALTPAQRGEFVCELTEVWDDLKAYEEQMAELNPDEAELHMGAVRELEIALRTLALTFTTQELGMTDLPTNSGMNPK